MNAWALGCPQPQLPSAGTTDRIPDDLKSSLGLPENRREAWLFGCSVDLREEKSRLLSLGIAEFFGGTFAYRQMGV